MTLIYEEKTELLRRCFFDVQNEVGLGRQEEAYHQGCKLWFQEHGIPFASKLPHRLMLDGREVYSLHPDFVVWDQITIELKAVLRRLGPAELVQLFDYLKFRRDQVGLLVNFGLDRVEIERRVYEPQETQLVEDWSYWSGQIEGADRELGIIVRDALRAIYSAHSTGYGDEVLSRLVPAALSGRGLPFVASPYAKAFYHGVQVDEAPLDCLIINGRMLLTWTALFDTNQFSINRGLSYLPAFDLTWGVAADFGKHQLQMTGLNRRNKSSPQIASSTRMA